VVDRSYVVASGIFHEFAVGRRGIGHNTWRVPESRNPRTQGTLDWQDL
jgi:hypothetical protein